MFLNVNDPMRSGKQGKCQDDCERIYRYPNIRAWLERIEGLPKFTGMVRSPVPQAA
jgi:hypothetical protein